MRRGKKLLIIVTVLLLVGCGLLYPFQTTIVPVWNITLVDENGVPYPEQAVTESWKHYSLELEAGQHLETKWTDYHGQVIFPRRTIRMSILRRLIELTLTSINRYMHGSTGVYADVMTTSPSGIKTVEYDPSMPPPDKLVLLRSPIK